MNLTYRPEPVPIDVPGEPAVRLIPLGGLGEIGLNMMLIESGPDILAVDCGLLFPDDEMPGVDFAIPDFAYLRERLPAAPVPRVVVLDNAGIHTSKAVKAARPSLARLGIYLYYLPAYSPELKGWR